MLFTILTTPIEYIGIASASNEPETTITVSGVTEINSNQTIAYSNGLVSIQFSVTIPSGIFVSGNYWYSGIINGNGNYSDGSYLNLTTNSSGLVNLYYRAQSNISSENNHSLSFTFDLNPPFTSI